MSATKGGAPGWRELRAHRIAQQRKDALARKKERRRVAPQGQDEDDEPPKKGKASAPARGAKPRIGFVRGSTIERLFILMIYAGVLALVALSVVGTFYGSRAASAPITDPGAIWTTMAGSGNAIWVAIGVQAALSLTQYGARQLARHDWRWWLLYLGALGISVYFNIQAYYAPLLAFMFPMYAYALIVAFDVLPEFVSIRHD